MIKVVEESELEDMIFKDNYILIMCKKLSSDIIKKLGRKCHKVGIYYQDGFVLDTVNGVLSKFESKENLDYELSIYPVQQRMLMGLKDYQTFYDFIKMRRHFLKYYSISLYWDETKKKCIYEKTTPLDKLGGSIPEVAFKPIRQININSTIFKKIKFVPDLEETLNSFVDETKVSQFYREK